MQKVQSRNEKWDQYGTQRLLSRNRLIFFHHRLVMEYFLSCFYRLSPNLKVLDVGCGDGYFLEHLRNLGFINIQGIDASQPFVNACLSKGLNVEIGDIYKIKDDKKYDAVLCCEVLEHLEAPGTALEKMKDALSDQGFIFLTVPIAMSLHKRWQRLVHAETALDQLKQVDETHRHAFTVKTLGELALRSGLSVASTWIGSNPFPFADLLSKFNLSSLSHWLQRRTFKGSCGDCLIMVLTKRR